MTYKKIHIIGGPGSGKSYLADKLSIQYKIDDYDLDDIFWDNSAISYGTKADVDIRNKKLLQILSNKSWIIEGVYYAWLDESFSDADIIIVLNTKIYIRDYRIIKRFLKRKLDIEISKKKETWKSLFELLRWNHKFEYKNMIEIEKILMKYNDKTVFIRNISELNKLKEPF
jgi:adenylate kinase family enzyme